MIHEASLANIPQHRRPKEDHERFLLAMWLIFATRPGKAEPEEDGSFFVGEINDARITDQRLRRVTPYSTCEGIRK